MANYLKIREQTHKIWRILSTVSGILCIVLFLTFWYTNDAFWTGIFRLGAFIFFAGAMLSYLKTMGGPLMISLDTTDDLLIVSYHKKGETIHEEEFDKNAIKKVEITNNDKNLFSSYLQPRSATFKVHFTDTEQELFLFEFSGRPLSFDKKTQQKISNYLATIDIKA